jgi:hypothetical protein
MHSDTCLQIKSLLGAVTLTHVRDLWWRGLPDAENEGQFSKMRLVQVLGTSERNDNNMEHQLFHAVSLHFARWILFS